MKRNFLNARKITFAVAVSTFLCGTTSVMAEEIPSFGWYEEGGKNYWYEDGNRQGTYEDAKGVLGDGTVRGREIYDPESDGWYWLDAVYDGAKAVNKEVWMPYIYQNEAEWGEDEIAMNASNSGDMAQQVINEINNKSGKWVRYDENGKMYKGWYKVEGAAAEIYPEQAGNIYYYDPMTGLMAKGAVNIDGKLYNFDETTGVLKEFVGAGEFREGEEVVDGGFFSGVDWTLTNEGRLFVSGVFEIDREKYSVGMPEECPDVDYYCTSYLYEELPWNKYGDSIVEAVIDSDYFRASFFFDYLPNLHTVDLSGCSYIDTLGGDFFTNCPDLEDVNLSGVTIDDCKDLFKNKKSLLKVDMSDAVLSGSMFGMFYGCDNLVSVDFSGIDTSKVTNMAYLFWKCGSLTELDMSDVDTDNVTAFYDAFAHCSNLVSVNLCNADFSNAEDLGGMFSSCSSLVNIDLGGLKTEKVINCKDVFTECSSLEELNLVNLDMRNVISCARMFYDSPNLKTIYVGDGWQIPEDCVTLDMFLNCGTDTVIYK